VNKIIRKVKGVIAYDLGMLENRFYWKTKKYLKKYYNDINKKTVTQNKTLIYMLDGRAYSGGLSDIIKGILSMYKFSKEIGFDFRINFCFPYSLEEYLQPNLYNWKIPENEISYNSNDAISLWLYSSYLNYGKTCEFEENFQKKVLIKFLKKNESKQQFHVYTNSEWIKGPEYAFLFNELFKPSKRVQQVLDFHKQILNNNYVSMTFRFQQLLGDFENKNSNIDRTADFFLQRNNAFKLKNKVFPDHGELQLRAILGDFKNKNISIPLNEEDKKSLMKKCIQKITEIYNDFFPNTKILITADSETFLAEVSKLDFVYMISNDSVQLEDYPSNNYNMFLKAYIDILMLSEAKKLHLLCTSGMYRSGFAKNASFINNKEYEEINF